MSCHYPFRLTTWLAISAVAAFVALTPVVHAQIAQQAALSGSAKADGAPADNAGGPGHGTRAPPEEPLTS